jgi:hypothetical protein
MYSLFKTKRTEPITQNKAVFEYCLLVQNKWAGKMSLATSRLSKRKLICSLVLFVILTGSTCFYNISQGLCSKARQSIKIITVSIPIEAVQKSHSVISSPLPASKAEFKRISGFRKHLDSLRKSTKGKKTFDSIMLNRTGFMDSLIFIENYYKSNLKN